MHPREKIATSLFDVSNRCRRQRNLSGEPIVLTSGCFDLLHGGHLEYLIEAGSKGFLVVGVNSDPFVRKLKGAARPVRDQNDRVFTLAGFEPVSLAVVFDDDIDLIKSVMPNIYIASSTSHVRVWDDPPRLSTLRDTNCVIFEISSKKEESTTAMIRRASSVA